MDCNFCKKTFSSLSSLNNHKVTAKYCLKIQNKTIDEKFKCAYCDKNFTSKNALTLHTKTCKDLDIIIKTKDKDIIIATQKNIIEQLQRQEEQCKEQLQRQEEQCKEQLQRQEEQYKEQLGQYTQQIKELQDKLERLATTAISKPSTTNNNNTKILLLSPLDLSQERISNIVSTKLNGDHIVDGIAGLAKFVKDEIIKDENGKILYNCVDSSRQMFKYKNENGDVIKDKNANKLIGAIQPALKEKTNDLYFEYGNKIENYVPDEEDRRNAFTKKDKYIFLKDTALKINEDISDMHQNTKFCTELANQVTN
jgi:esterase/lipase